MSTPLGFLDAINWSKPDRVGDDGRRYFDLSIPTKHPDAWFVIPGGQFSRDINSGTIQLTAEAIDLTEIAAELGFEPRAGIPAERVIIDDGDGVVLDPDATGDPGSDDDIELDRVLVSGIASSTSQDFFGTEMSLRALQIMALQMQRGIPYLPQHNHGLSGPVEWHEIIGHTVHAEVVPVDGDQLAKPHDPSESHFVLRPTMAMIPVPSVMAERDPAEVQAGSLLKRLDRGEIIGQSIGGWFTRLQVIQNEEGDVERVIVQGVDLDHLAVTRAPANPDAIGIIRLRSAVERSAYESRGRRLVENILADRAVSVSRGRFADWLVSEARTALAGAIVEGKYSERHVVSVANNEDGTVSVRFVIHDQDQDQSECKCGNQSQAYEDGDQDAPKGSKRSIDEVSEEPGEEGEAFDTHAQIEAACSLTVEHADGRTILSWDDGESADNIHGAVRTMLAGDHGEEVQRALQHATSPQPGTPGELDETESAVQDMGVTDAHRSAPTDTISPAGPAGTTSEEPPMSDLSLDAIRSLLTETLKPVTDRLDALEAKPEERSTPDPVTEPDPNSIEAKLAAAEERAQAAVARAERSERALGDVMSKPHRVGRATLSIPEGAGAAGAYGGLVERARETAPAFAALVQRAIPVLTGQKVEGDQRSQRTQLEDILAAGLRAAEHDGLITDPNTRAAAGWQ
jgi:hypothetical protein